VEHVRLLIKENLDNPVLLDLIGDSDDLIAAGVNSGEMIRIAFGCEKRLARRLTDAELTALTSIEAIATVLKAG
jgi:acyl carrier protein